MHLSIRNLIGALVALIGVLLVLSLIGTMHAGMWGTASQTEHAAPSPLDLKTTASGDIIAPEITPTMQAVLEESKGFQALVSYTDRGFEPRSLSIEKGDTVRFTNNSIRDLWVASSGTPYPRGGDTCGESAFDSCIALKPLEFWEFTFDATGEWQYTDNLHKEFTGTVRVR